MQVGALALVRDLSVVRRLALVPLVAWLAAGCGASPPVPIPSASPSPAASPTTIAPGVQVPTTEVKTPSYTVSTSHPLPPGVSAAAVAQDVVIDNLIENVAIERGDAALLSYADCGNWLAAVTQEIQTNAGRGIHVTRVSDAVTSMAVGTKADPAAPSLTIAIVISGTETEASISASGSTTKSTPFAVIRWVVWNTGLDRYLTCDTGSS